MIPFTEQGMRTFKDVRSAIEYFRKNGNFPQKRIVALFQSTFQIVSGKYSVNVLELQKSGTEIDSYLLKAFKVKNEDRFKRTLEVFRKEMDKWNNKFKDSDIRQEAIKA